MHGIYDLFEYLAALILALLLFPVLLLIHLSHKIALGGRVATTKYQRRKARILAEGRKGK